MYYLSKELAVYGVSLIIVWLIICLYIYILKLQGVQAGLNQMTTITRLLKSFVRKINE